MTRRPSASVLVTSVVRPPQCRITSPGRSEPPEIEFSAAATSPTTGTGQPTAPSAAMVAMTAPPPVMSRFMLAIASPGLMEMPPVSKVMPLPTSTTGGVRRSPRPLGR